MEIHEIRDGDVLVLAPDGSITDSEETSALEEKLGTALKAGGRLVVFDCAGAGNLTSSALRALLLASRKLDRTEGRLVLCGAHERLAKAFSISGVDKDVTVVATRDEALRRVREPILPRAVREKKAVRKRKAPAPQEAPQEAVSQESAPAIDAVPEPVAPLAPAVHDVAAAADLPAASIDASPAAAAPMANASDAIVDVLLDKLGMRGARGVAAHASGPVPSNLDALATGLLAALRTGRP